MTSPPSRNRVKTLTLFYFENVLLRIIANIFIIIYCYNRVQSPLLKTGPRESYIIVVWSHLLMTGPRVSYIIVVWSPLLKTGPRLSYIIVV